MITITELEYPIEVQHIWELLGREDAGDKSWVMYTLHIDDIREMCKECGVPFNKLTNDNITNIVRNFRKSVEGAMYEWDLLLTGAIGDEYVESSQSPAGTTM